MTSDMHSNKSDKHFLMYLCTITSQLFYSIISPALLTILVILSYSFEIDVIANFAVKQ